jgi:hypothetical protein
MRLALATGHLDVGVMLAGISLAQWRQWQAYDLLEPIGFPRAENRYSMLAALTAKTGSGPDAFAYQPPLPVSQNQPPPAVESQQSLAEMTSILTEASKTKR